MPAGGAFNLVLKDDRFDECFTATSALRSRLKRTKASRAAQGEKIIQPTLTELGSTHVQYLRGKYMPHIAMASEYTKIKPSGDGSSAITASGGSLEFTFGAFGHFTSDMAIHIRFAPVGSKTSTTAPLLRYCAMLGARLFSRVSFSSDGVLIAEYTSDDYIAHSKFFIGPDQKAGWERCIGQQELREATYYANGFTASLMYRDGPQTPKTYHDSFNIFIPLRFFFCDDLSQALFNDLVPNSQRKVTCQFAPLDKILQAATAAAVPPIGSPLLPGGLTPTTLDLQRLGIQADLYVNSITVNPEVYDVYAARCRGSTIIRVTRQQTYAITTPSDSRIINLKWPMEYVIVSVRSKQLAQDFDRWWLTGAITVRENANKLFVPAIIWNPVVAGGICQLVVREAVDSSALSNVVATIGAKAHGIDLMPAAAPAFYNAYVPIRYGKNSLITAPTDTNTFLLTFAAYPGKALTSGYYNLSAGRELYLDLELLDEPSAYGGVEVVLSASMLNIMSCGEDKLELRYSI